MLLDAHGGAVAAGGHGLWWSALRAAWLWSASFGGGRRGCALDVRRADAVRGEVHHAEVPYVAQVALGAPGWAEVARRRHLQLERARVAPVAPLAFL